MEAGRLELPNRLGANEVPSQLGHAPTPQGPTFSVAVHKLVVRPRFTYSRRSSRFQILAMLCGYSQDTTLSLQRWPRLDLNKCPLAYQANALPLSYAAKRWRCWELNPDPRGCYCASLAAVAWAFSTYTQHSPRRNLSSPHSIL